MSARDWRSIVEEVDREFAETAYVHEVYVFDRRGFAQRVFKEVETPNQAYPWID